MTHDEMIKVIQAERDGEEILEGFKSWHKKIGKFNFVDFNYRVKPKTIWVNEYTNNTILPYSTKAEALGNADRVTAIRIAVEFQEVIR